MSKGAKSSTIIAEVTMQKKRLLCNLTRSIFQMDENIQTYTRSNGSVVAARRKFSLQAKIRKCEGVVVVGVWERVPEKEGGGGGGGGEGVDYNMCRYGQGTLID